MSPPGGDISEPVSQATLRIVKVFWGLDSSLAYKRHFPAINWLTSYSLYADSLSEWFNRNVNQNWYKLRGRLMNILQEESELEEIVKLVGMDALSPTDRLKLEAARSIRGDYLHQNAFNDTDTYTSLEKQFLLMELILAFYDKSLDALNRGASIEKIVSMPARERIGRFKYIAENDIKQDYDNIISSLESDIDDAVNTSEKL